jgi:hypothetical protein
MTLRPVSQVKIRLKNFRRNLLSVTDLQGQSFFHSFAKAWQKAYFLREDISLR